MTQINAVIFPNAEEWLTENLPDLCVDGVSCVYPDQRWNFAGTTRFIDDYDEDQPAKEIDMPQLVKALGLMCNLIDNGKLFVGCVKASVELQDPCNWDVEVTDAFYQLAFYEEVIYG